MTPVIARPARSRPGPAARRPGLAAARLLGLELRHNAMLWLLPVVLALFWLTYYRKTMAPPPLWSLRASSLQTGAVAVFAAPVAGAAAWMGTREARRHVADLVAVTARPRWARQLTTWAATACWAIVGYLVCLAVVYGVTAHQVHWGGPLWWPAAVTAAALAALAALGFAAGTLLPSRFTAPVTAIAAFFVVALSTQLIVGSQSYWQVSPIVTNPWDIGSDAGVATFYPYVPDLAIAQVMFLAGVTVAVLGLLAVAAGPAGGGGCAGPPRRSPRPACWPPATGAGLAGTGTLDPHGMITIPALHDAASDRPLRFTPVCSRTAIPVCLNPAYASYLPATAAALRPVLSQLAGLPGAPARVSQAAAVYHQEAGNGVAIGLAGPRLTGTPPVYRLLLPDQLTGPALTGQQWAAQLRISDGSAIVASVTGAGPGASRPRTRSRRRSCWRPGCGWRRRPGARRSPDGHRVLDGCRPASGYRPGGAKRSPGAGRARSVCPRCRRWRPARPVMPPPSGSPRSRLPCGTPGWSGTWPRCGPASSPWPSCHERGPDPRQPLAVQPPGRTDHTSRRAGEPRPAEGAGRSDRRATGPRAAPAGTNRGRPGPGARPRGWPGCTPGAGGSRRPSR